MAESEKTQDNTQNIERKESSVEDKEGSIIKDASLEEVVADAELDIPNQEEVSTETSEPFKERMLNASKNDLVRVVKEKSGELLTQDLSGSENNGEGSCKRVPLEDRVLQDKETEYRESVENSVRELSVQMVQSVVRGVVQHLVDQLEDELNEDPQDLSMDLSDASPNAKLKQNEADVDEKKLAEQAKQRVRRYKRERKIREERKRQAELAEMEMLDKKLKEMEENKKKEAELAVERKRKKLEERIKRRQQAKSEEKVEKIRNNNFVKEIHKKAEVSAAPLYKRLEDDFQKKIAQEEEEKKKILEDMKSQIHQPDLKEIEEHTRRHKEITRKQQEKDRERRRQMQKDLEQNTPQFYKGAMRVAIEEEVREIKAQRDREKQLKQEMVEKQRNYARLVREVYAPIVKREEMDALSCNSPVHQNEKKSKQRPNPRLNLPALNRESVSHPPDHPAKSLDLPSVKKHRKIQNSFSELEPNSEKELESYSKHVTNWTPKSVKPRKAFENETSPTRLSIARQEASKASRKAAMERKVRMERQRQLEDGIEKDIPSEKIRKIHNRAKKLEQSAHEREQSQEDSIDFAEDVVVSEMYIDAIKAKLALLQQVS